jgi:hypothetical protein
VNVWLAPAANGTVPPGTTLPNDNCVLPVLDNAMDTTFAVAAPRLWFVTVAVNVTDPNAGIATFAGAFITTDSTGTVCTVTKALVAALDVTPSRLLPSWPHAVAVNCAVPAAAAL